MSTPSSYTYAEAGVDIDAGDALVERVKPAAASTRRPGADADLGGFGALFDPRAAGFADPILVASTDGVGTKLEIAQATGRLDGVGVDLVAMCVNDILAQGAEPLFFLDYFATGRLSVDHAARVVEGIALGCRRAGCALVGGETAEMPGFYEAGRFDLAGFTVGAAERGTLLPRDVGPGDVILGLASSGVHSNGFSLVRRLVADHGLDWEAPAPFDENRTLADALLEPTRIYVESVLPEIRAGRVKACAHITGGGLPGNLPRVLPADCGFELERDAWPRPPVFDWLQKAGDIADDEMLRTFNCGVGLAVVCAAPDAALISEKLKAAGESVFAIGRVSTA